MQRYWKNVLKRPLCFAVAVVFVVFCYGCPSPQVIAEPVPAVRIVIESLFGQASTAKVYVEAVDGNLLTGARVVIGNSSLVASLMNFNYTEGAYTSVIPPSADGLYYLSIQSAMFDEPYNQIIHHYVLSEKPQITLLQDESAHSALAGITLDAGQSVNIQWSEAAQATVYQVCINKNGSAVLVQSVAGTSVSVPAASIGPAGAYTVAVTAQFIAGDPLLTNANYYSYSEKTGSSVLFLTQ